MNIRDLQYLIAVADYRHFSKAAAACFVSQPGLSMQIKKLEETLGVQLIERTQKSVLLTDIGTLITEKAREILRQVEVMKEIAHQAEDPFSGSLHLGVIPTLAPYLLPNVLPDISACFPNLSLYLVENTTENLLERLVQGKLDAALLALPVEEENLVTSPLFEETFVLAVPIRHALAKRKKVCIADLNDQTLLLLEEGHCLRDQALTVCHQATVKKSTNFQATSLETLKQMVAFNAGITLVPKLSEQTNDDIAYVSFSAPQPKRIIGIVYRASSAKKIVLDAMSVQIKKSLSFQPVKVLA